MKKKSLVIILFLFLFVLLSGCSKMGPDNLGAPNNDGENGEQSNDGNNVKNRKIIYKASATLEVDNLVQSIISIKDYLEDDEWLDKENIINKKAYLIVRVKSSRIDNFILFLSNRGEVKNLDKSATDISLAYFDKANKIASYQAERDRLLELYEQASINEMIQLNTRISQIDTELLKLKGELNQYDSLIEYSEVTLTITDVATAPKKSFDYRVRNAFTGGINALIVFFETLIIFIAAVFPFVAVFGTVGLGVYVGYKYYKKKKQNNKINK